MPRILRTRRSLDDLANIWACIAADNPVAADQVLKDVESALSLIATVPDLGFKLEQHGRVVRCKPVRRNYLLFYIDQGEEIHLLRVLHSSRKFDGLL